jgi:hypothetical protein
MTQPVLTPPVTGSRSKLIVAILIFAVLFLLGSQVVDPRVSRRVFAGGVALTGIISGIIPALGPHRPKLASWLARASVACAVIMVGVLMRMLIHGLRG